MGRKKREYSYDDWKKAMELHNRFKLGCRRISRILGISEGTVSNWLYKGMIPPTTKWVAKPSIELAYIIGTIHGDGNVCKSKTKLGYEYIIQLGVIDKEFAIIFSKVMAKLLGVKYHKPYWDNKQKEWRVKYRSKAFYLWYKKCEEQGLQGFKEYIEYNKKTVRYYLRGLFDSDGNNYGNKRIRLTNTNKELLGYVQHLLKKYFNVATTGPYLQRKNGTKMIINGVETTARHDCYIIQIRRREHIQKYIEEIGFSIVRKQLGLRRDEKIYVEGIGYIQPFKLVELGLFKLPFSNVQ